ncbi:MAG: DNA topoisomerase IV subunit B, partial [Dehalococcoidia bacterium]|nr:DNA topoisomerase IV subunit B [Dehalococcoidia bacterium]
MTTQATSSSYTAENIQVLEGLEAVRRRPGMYIGTTDKSGLHHLIKELVDNAVDEAMAGFCDRVEVVIRDDGWCTVRDNGRGIPVDIQKQTGKTAVETVMTVLHAGGKFDGNSYKTAGGLHGVGASVVNALSKHLVAVIKRDGFQFRMEFAKGKAKTKLQKLKGKVRGTGTTITFTPDPTIFPKIDFDPPTILARLEITSFLHRGVKVNFVDEVNKTDTSFH